MEKSDGLLTFTFIKILPCKILLASSHVRQSEFHSSIMTICVNGLIVEPEKRPSETTPEMNLEGIIPNEKIKREIPKHFISTTCY